mmetsp:Transcript_7067/g.10398  ORF Transcript_7067/g.10398 Transcript_7067/m.10398 type:complete len:310 (-) Transcript_7067:1881-2810(-)
MSQQIRSKRLNLYVVEQHILDLLHKFLVRSAWKQGPHGHVAHDICTILPIPIHQILTGQHNAIPHSLRWVVQQQHPGINIIVLAELTTDNLVVMPSSTIGTGGTGPSNVGHLEQHGTRKVNRLQQIMRNMSMRDHQTTLLRTFLLHIAIVAAVAAIAHTLRQQLARPSLHDIRQQLMRFVNLIVGKCCNGQIGQGAVVEDLCGNIRAANAVLKVAEQEQILGLRVIAVDRQIAHVTEYAAGPAATILAVLVNQRRQIGYRVGIRCCIRVRRQQNGGLDRFLLRSSIMFVRLFLFFTITDSSFLSTTSSR